MGKVIDLDGRRRQQQAHDKLICPNCNWIITTLERELAIAPGCFMCGTPYKLFIPNK